MGKGKLIVENPENRVRDVNIGVCWLLRILYRLYRGFWIVRVFRKRRFCLQFERNGITKECVKITDILNKEIFVLKFYL